MLLQRNDGQEAKHIPTGRYSLNSLANEAVNYSGKIVLFIKNAQAILGVVFLTLKMPFYVEV